MTAQMPAEVTTNMAAMSVEKLNFDPMALLSIFEPSQQVTIVARPEQAQLTSYLQQVSQRLGAGYRMTLRQAQISPARLDAEIRLPDAAGKEALLTDISALANLYAELMDCPKVGIRLEVLSRAMCPKFHIDRTGIRLLCTYLGPGTEWLEEAFCDRNALASAYSTQENFNQALIMHPKGIRQAPEQALVLLKGSLWQGNQQAGAIHRSPHMPVTSTRVVLALDAIW
ncbi:MAG: DUF1826 domain-containing protein [Methylophilus sp.]|uniref:DUF1826 domain-containing protein n=1 Tax=Methylophilus sp. TaxID=29541 RepID=UPI003FA0BB5E